MSLFYSVVFTQNAPDLEPLVSKVAANYDTSLEVITQHNNKEIFFQNGHLLLALRASDRTDYYELSFGEYHYKKRWYITLGKEDTIAASSLLFQLVGKVASEFTLDFLFLFNGELVILKKEAGILYLNQEADVWSNANNLAIFQNSTLEFVSYPVNY